MYHGKVATAIGALAQGAPQSTRDTVKQLKRAWQDNHDSYRWSFGAAASVGDRPGPAELRTDRQIARDFLYGDLVHADVDARQRLRMMPEEERLQAATVWVAEAVRLTEATRRLIIDLQDAGCLVPRP